jgi:peptidoglycan/LPS O-acetylase OafA/YrhL
LLTQQQPLPVTGNTEHTQPENRAFYPALDGLRAIAFLMVFFQHYYSLPWGWTGVNVFFVLSGFLITGILFDSRNDPHRARNFYIRRTLRIFPLYYGLFLILVLLYPFFRWQWSLFWLAWPLYLGNFLRFLSPDAAVTNSSLQIAGNGWLVMHSSNAQLNLGHLWSLCVEEQFYLFWPWIVFSLRSRRALMWVCGSAVVIVPIVRVVAQHTAPAWMLNNELLYRVTPFQLDSLLLGGLAALLWRGPHREQLIAAARYIAVLTGIAAVLYLAFTIHPNALPSWNNGYVYPSWRLTWGMSFVNVLTASIILTCLHTNNSLAAVLSIKPLRWLGRISYGAYVYHDIIQVPMYDFVNQLGNRWAFVPMYQRKLTIGLALASTLLIAWLSFRFFESPFLDLKERWTIRPS